MTRFTGLEGISEDIRDNMQCQFSPSFSKYNLIRLNLKTVKFIVATYRSTVPGRIDDC